MGEMNKQSCHQFPFSSLPQELKKLILACAQDTRTLCAMHCVCSEWKSIIQRTHRAHLKCRNKYNLSIKPSCLSWSELLTDLTKFCVYLEYPQTNWKYNEVIPDDKSEVEEKKEAKEQKKKAKNKVFFLHLQGTIPFLVKAIGDIILVCFDLLVKNLPKSAIKLQLDTHCEVVFFHTIAGDCYCVCMCALGQTYNSSLQMVKR